MKEKIQVLFVCMGNICRSPTAHGVFRSMVEAEGLGDVILIDSAGTHAYHVGNSPDRRAVATAASRGIDLTDLEARQVESEDFERFDYVVAMDQDNFLSLSEICPNEHMEKVHLFMDFAPQMRTREVPDPYYGGKAGFERVFDLVDAASRALLADIRRRHLSG
jgi:protein-tyrosine phosphatase